MTDAIVLSSRGNAFEAAFAGLGLSSLQATPATFGSPLLPPAKLLVVPSGFADPKYYLGVGQALERSAEKIAGFLERGGVVLAFGAMLTDYDYDWLPGRTSYRMLFKEADVRLVDAADPAALLMEQPRYDCDGYFTSSDARVVGVREEGRPVLVSRQVGKGYAIITGMHLWPTGRFLRWACDPARGPAKI